MKNKMRWKECCSKKVNGRQMSAGADQSCAEVGRGKEKRVRYQRKQMPLV